MTEEVEKTEEMVRRETLDQIPSKVQQAVEDVANRLDRVPSSQKDLAIRLTLGVLIQDYVSVDRAEAINYLMTTLAMLGVQIEEVITTEGETGNNEAAAI